VRDQGAQGALRRQLIAASITEPLVLLAIDGVRLGQDLLGDLPVVARRVAARVRVHLGAVDRDEPDLRESGLGAQPQDLAEQGPERGLVALAKARDGAVIRPLVGGDHAAGDILHAPALDRPRGPAPERVGVEEQRDHHRRVVGRATVPSWR